MDEKKKTKKSKRAVGKRGEKSSPMLKMTGHWLVYFGIDGVIEGSRILTLKGMFDGETMLSEFSNHITASLTEEAQKVIRDSGNNIVIRNLVKLS